MAVISKEQIKKIHAIARELGYDRDRLYDIVWKAVRSDSISKLTVTQGIEVINALQAYKKSKGSKTVSMATGREGMVSEKQLWLINTLAKEMGWNDDPVHLRRFVKKYYGVDDMNFLTCTNASKVIEGMKEVKRKQSVKSKEICT